MRRGDRVLKHNVLHIVRSLEVGGLEQVVVALANFVAPERYRSHVCCIARAGQLAAQLRRRDSLWVIGNEGKVNIRSIRRVHDLMRDRAIDLVHAHNYPGLFYGYAPAKLRGIPIVYTLHGYHRRDEMLVFRYLEKIMSRSVDRFVCVSNELVPRVRRAFGVSEHKVQVVYNGIEDCGQPPPSARARGAEIVIGSVGRITHLKNYGLLLEAFDDVLKQRPNCRLEIVGDGEEYDRIANLARERSLGSRIVLHGAQLDVNTFYERFDIFALPSISEGHSIAILEALRMGIVCVVSAVGGNSEIIQDGRNGYLFQPCSKADLVHKLLYVIDRLGTAEMQDIRKRARQTICSEFSREKMVAAYERLYGELLGDRPPRALRGEGASTAPR